jgi:hypothetical protein
LVKYPQIAFIFDENFQYLDVASNTPQKSLDEVDMRRFNERKVVEGTVHILKKINCIPDEKLREVFILAFEIHKSALDNFDKEWLCCFKFWQILERLVLADQNLKYEDICKRLVPFIGHIEPFYDIIQLYSKKRHSYVHEANISEFSYFDVEIMKDISEFLLFSLLSKASKLKDFNRLKGIYESIDFYFKNVNLMDKTSLKTIKDKERFLHEFEKSPFFKEKLLF